MMCFTLRFQAFQVIAVPAALALLALPARAAETHQIDTVHSAVLFKVKHLEVGYSYGRFNDISGTIVLDDADPAKSTAEITIKAESIDTANAKRDTHLKSPDFFNVKQFPLITFKSKKVKKGADGKLEAEGALTLHGVTKDVTLLVERVGSAKDPRGGAKTGFHTVLKLKRSDFGMKFMVGPLGDEVEVTISLECATK
ncbi:MAG TPA: YceI family protein [Planctomycetota bacterium]|nr:YceI family protein [Planctomycetota bacterium]